MRKRSSIWLVLLAAASLSWRQAQSPAQTQAPAQTQPPAQTQAQAPARTPDVHVSRGSGGAVAAEEEIAARTGIEILRQGGNATDAAVAVALALAVTWPEAGNIGGGGFWLSRDPRGKVVVVDFREIAPRNARRDLYTRPDEHGAVPSSLDGPLASGVPGT